MAINTVYVLHGIVNSTTFISQITNARPSPQMETLIAAAAGMPFPQFVANMGVDPETAFDTTQVKTILDLSGALSSIVDLSAANTDLHFKAVTNKGRRTADASLAHIRFRMAQAWLSLDRISAGSRSEAVASVRLGTVFDGTNVPLVPAGSLALAGTPTSAEHFVAGPVELNTVALPGVQEITIEMNRQVLKLHGDGELYNTFAAHAVYSPVVTIRCTEHDWQTYGLNGTACTSLELWLRKVATTGRVANGTAEHIKFTATSGLISVDETSSGGNETAMTTYRVSLVGANATTEPITVSTTTAIA